MSSTLAPDSATAAAVAAADATAARARLALPPGTTTGMPVEGLVVPDLPLAGAGPTWVRHLADWGANIIRVQPPDDENEEIIGRRDGSDYQNLHRNKRVISLDLKSADGHAAFLELVRSADVVVENMRVQVKHRLKISWEEMKAVNPRLVYGSISGFGQTGPYAHRPGVDQIAQGMSGLMSVTGAPGSGPNRAGIAVSDVTAGNLLALAIMIAVYEREKTGVGRWVHTSLLESQVFMLDFQATRYLVNKEVPQQVGNDHPTAVPMGVFETSDGHINIGASSSGLWKRLCESMEKPEWLTDPKWTTQRARAGDREALHNAIREVTRTQSTAFWVDKLDKAGIPAGPIYSIDQVSQDPQVQHLGIAAPIRHPKFGDTHLVGSPLNVDGVAKKIRSAAPVTGVHTDEVLSAVGYTPEALAAMRAKKAI